MHQDLVLGGWLIRLFDVFEEFLEYENLDIHLESIVDNINGTGNLIIIIKTSLKGLAVEEQDILHRTISSHCTSFYKGKIKLDSEEQLIFEFQIERKKKAQRTS